LDASLKKGKRRKIYLKMYIYIYNIYICINRYIYIYYVFICLYHMKIDEDIKTYEN
jgi:hypothetical protein